MRDLELLIDDGLDADRARPLDERAHLCSEHAVLLRTRQQGSEAGDGAHDLHAVPFRGQALVDLQERDNPLDGPQIRHRVTAIDLAIHRVLEQNGSEDVIAVEARTLDDPATHGVHQREHLVVVRILVLVDAVQLEGLGSAAAALVQGGDEAPPELHLLELFVVHVTPPVDRALSCPRVGNGMRIRLRGRMPPAAPARASFSPCGSALPTRFHMVRIGWVKVQEIRVARLARGGPGQGPAETTDRNLLREREREEQNR